MGEDKMGDLLRLMGVGSGDPRELDDLLGDLLEAPPHGGVDGDLLIEADALARGVRYIAGALSAAPRDGRDWAEAI
jgi:hypothetical protein